MIKNATKHISQDEIDFITTDAKANNHYIATLDGRTIQSEQEYLIFMYDKFKFPKERPSYNGYFDWIRDLGWLIDDEGYKGFVLIIDYYKSFLEQEGPIYNYDLEDGREVHTFKEYLEIEGFPDITRYWEYDVIKYGGDDMPHSFNIYLVDR